MTRDTSLANSRYSESVDIHYYASTYNDKQKSAKLFEQQLVRTSLDDSFFKIKRKPFALINDTLSEHYKELQCRNCFNVVDDPHTNNYYLNVLNIDELFRLRNSMNLGFKCLRWMVKVNDCSIDIPKNEQLLEYVQEECSRKIDQHSYPFFISSIEKVCRKFAYSLSFAFLKFIGISFYLLSYLFPNRLIVSSIEVENIRRAQERDLPILYVLRDPSPTDWFSVLLTLLFVNAKIPVVLRYENGKSRLSRWILKKCGVIFIRPPHQEINRDDAPNRVCDRAWSFFIEELVRAKNHFIIDLHTPQGDPDVWLLSLISQCISQQVTEDVLVTPVIVNRNKDLEEFSPKWLPKHECSKIIHSFRGKFVKVNFFRPFSLKDLLYKNVREILPHQVYSLTNKIVSHLKYDFSRVRPIMTTDLISYLLLKKYRNGVHFDNLVDEITEFFDTFVESHQRVAFTGSSQAVVRHAVKTLGPRLIKCENRNGEKFIKPILELPFVLKMADHAHETMMHFMMDAILFTSISIIFPNEFECAFKTDTELKFTFNQLQIHVERLRDILQFEYAFDKFCQSSYSDLEEGIMKLTYHDFIKKVEILMTEEEEWGHRLARRLEESDESDYDDMYYGGDRSPSPRRNIRDDSDVYVLNFSGKRSFFEETVLYRNALKPYLQAYAISAENLSTLNDKSIPSQYYYKTLTDKIKLKLKDNQLHYPEILSSNLLRNTLKLFQKWEVIDRYQVHDVEFISISKKFQKASALKEIVEKIDILN